MIMSTSPYFSNTVRRQTRSAAKLASELISKSQLKKTKHIIVAYEDEGSKSLQSDSRKRKTLAASARCEDDRKTEYPNLTKGKRGRKSDLVAKTKGVWEPANWREQLANIREMRRDRDAPVDSQGCERTADMKASPEVMFLKLVWGSLSGRTKNI